MFHLRFWGVGIQKFTIPIDDASQDGEAHVVFPANLVRDAEFDRRHVVARRGSALAARRCRLDLFGTELRRFARDDGSAGLDRAV